MNTMKTKARWFWLVVAAQTAFLLGWAGWHEHVRSHAPTILLKTRPVDPQDLLRGDYMILGYDIGTVTPPAGVNAGYDFWVRLVKQDGYHVAVAASAEKPELAPGEIAVLATHSGRGVAYGIENYYVPEGKGTPRFTKIEVQASVSPTHRLYIKRVLLDGKAYP